MCRVYDSYSISCMVIRCLNVKSVYQCGEPVLNENTEMRGNVELMNCAGLHFAVCNRHEGRRIRINNSEKKSENRFQISTMGCVNKE